MEALHCTGGNATVLKIQDEVESLNKIQNRTYRIHNTEYTIRVQVHYNRISRDVTNKEVDTNQF